MSNNYFGVVSAAFKKSLAYRVDNILSVVNRIIEVSVLIFIWKSIYQKETVIAGMDLSTLILYYALSYSIGHIMTWGINEEMGISIRKGTISMELLYPISYMNYFFCYKIGYVIRQLAVISFPALFILIILFKISIPISLSSLLCSLLILSLSVIIVFFIEFLFGLMTFYTSSEWGLQVLKKSLIMILSGAIAPISFFPEILQKIISILPFQDLLYSPITTFLNQNTTSEIYIILIRQGIWILILFLFCKLFYKHAMKQITIYGG